jgi:formylglycine-generating enzyme required for sulfatase activity
VAQNKKLEDAAKAKAEADAAQAELSTWNTALQSDTEAAYNTYLKQYPSGPHAVLAKSKGKKALDAAIEKIAPVIASNMVTIPGKNYELGKYEVTQKEWQAVMGSNPSAFTYCGDNCPVEQVSWDDIQIFLQKLNAKTGRQYRLPTEVEWEYACYGGSRAEYCGSKDINAVAWYIDNSKSTPHPGGQKQANGYGLYDMSGNVLEWMQNMYDESKPDVGRALRGGSYNVTLPVVRAAKRSWGGAAVRIDSLGFRLARTLP